MTGKVLVVAAAKGLKVASIKEEEEKRTKANRVYCVVSRVQQQESRTVLECSVKLLVVDGLVRCRASQLMLTKC